MKRTNSVDVGSSVDRKRKYKDFKRLSLVEEICSILQKYPEDGQIFKELIQNAEDAGASEIVFIYDENSNDNSLYNNFSREGLARFQGPSLYAYNNGFFEEKDWDGIRSLGISNKANDPLKVGRFGLGFKSVFHLTDIPSIASGHEFGYLDPLKLVHTTEMEFLDFKTEEDLKTFKEKDDFKSFQSLPEAYSIDSTGYCNGTLFRFPLRREKTTISKLCCTKDKIWNLINTYQSEGCMNLLFLKNIKSIKFFTIQNDMTDVFKELYSAQITLKNIEQFGQSRQQFVDDIRKNTVKSDFKPMSLKHHVEINETCNNETQEKSFVISELFGYDLKDDFHEMITDEDLSYIPFISLALPLRDGEGGHIFCCLPLPLREKCITGLPVHVNGYFALGQDRKDLKWKTLSATECTDKSILWNESLIKYLIPIAYSNLLEYLVESGFPEIEFYSAWPDVDKVNEKWKTFLNEFYDFIRQIKCIFVPSKSLWVHANDALFLQEKCFVSEYQFSAVQNLLLNLGQNVVSVPTHVLRALHGIAKNVTKEIVQEFLKSKYAIEKFQGLSNSEQSSVLDFIICDSHDVIKLIKIDIFMLVDGTYGKIDASTSDPIYLGTDDHPSELLPDQQNVIHSLIYGKHSFIQVLHDFAQEESTNLLSLDSVDTVLAAIQSIKASDLSKLPWDSSLLWLSSFWSYQQKHDIDLERLDGLDLIPVTTNNEHSLNQLQLDPMMMLETPLNSCDAPIISSEMKSFLSLCGIKFVQNVLLGYQTCYTLATNRRLLLPDSNGIVTAIKIVDMSSTSGFVQNAVSKSSSLLRKALRNAVKLSTVELPTVICELDVFDSLVPNLFTSINHARLVKEVHAPKIWKPDLQPIVLAESIGVEILEKFSMETWDFENVIRYLMVNLHFFERKEKDELIVSILEFLPNNSVANDLVTILQDKIDVNIGSSYKRPSELFQHSSFLDQTFLGEDEIFLPVEYSQYSQGLVKLGLKRGIADISEENLVNSVKFIVQCNKRNHEIDNKVKCILEVAKTQNFKLTNVCDESWIPVAMDKPTMYPLTLSWSSSEYMFFAKPSQILLSRYAAIIGSTSPVVDSALESVFEDVFVDAVPSILLVCKHFLNISISYNQDEKLVYQKLLNEVYSNFTTRDTDEVVTILKDLNTNLWLGDKFVERKRILTMPLNIRIEPYYYSIPAEFPYSVAEIVKQLGCNDNELDVYINVLKEMMETQEEKQDGYVTDTKLAIEILAFIATQESIDETLKEAICVPVDSGKFCKLKECFYHDFGSEIMFSGVTDQNILHRDISRDIAVTLGIPDLVSEVLSGGDDLFESWGQSEPLTLRLNRLLKDYTDGLAIPKELIQNADDAGATEISFLYDERENNDLKSRLINKNMNEWQGPALWVYNNAKFSEDDFCNITKLNAGTKEFDNNKIGKFGLGFNSVYHLTDVPSFVSGESMIIFDPHTDYLGPAIKDKSKPGLRIPLSKSRKNLRHFSDQFKVFDCVFGARLDFANEYVLPFDGTLFRLPLRNSFTAARSKIKEFEYTDSEMKLLLEQLHTSLDYLLLFAQNIKKFSCYHLSKNADSPNDMVLRFDATKHFNSEPGINILKRSSEILESFYLNPQILIPTESFIDNISITSTDDTNTKKTSTWLVSSCTGSKETYEFATRNKGYNPCGGIAIELIHNNESRFQPDVSKDHYMFCFLPIPELSYLPVHVNGSFEVSNDRRHLTIQSTDEKRYGNNEQFNHLLAKDLGTAYFNLILKLKAECQLVSCVDWFKVIPSGTIPMENEVIVKLVKSFLQKVLLSEEKLFPSPDGKWFKWKEVVVISKEIKQNIGISAIQYLNWYYGNISQCSSRVCLNIPDTFISLLTKFGFGDMLSSIPLNEFLDYFFQGIESNTLDIELRNCLMHSIIPMALTSSDNYLKNLICSNACIPTQPNGLLRTPSRLVKANSEIARIFEVVDEVFVSSEFDRHMYQLEQLGMNSDMLPWKLVLNRAESIEGKSTERDMIMRSELLMQLIADKLRKKNEIITPHDKLQLMKAKFIITKQKTADSIFNNWFSSGTVFASPSQVFNEEFLDVVCCSGLVCNSRFNDSVLEFFSIKHRLPPEQQIKTQINELSTMLENKKIDNRSRSSLVNIYDFLREYDTTYDKTFLRSLNSYKLIYTESGDLVKPTSVYVYLEKELLGFMHKLPSRLKDEHKKVMSEIGVREQPHCKDYVDALSHIYGIYKGKPLDDTLLKSILHSAVPFLYDNWYPASITQPLYLPDNKNCMKDVNLMNFKDVHFLPDIPNVCYAHTAISPHFCLKLGIKPLGESYFQDKSLGLAFGQHEELCTRIKNLLCGYSQVEDVLKELLQNADDAGATQVEFILDTRTHCDEKVFSREWKPLQGPALLVANNGKFTKSDLEAIQSLGEGNKSTDALKTGKYGVGFNAVYHLTDCPSFLTTIEGTEGDQNDVLCIFDPNLKYTNGASEEKPGRMIPNALKMLNSVYTDVGSAYLLDQFDLEGKTLFRLPLRSEDMVKSSKLCDKAISLRQMEIYLNRLTNISTQVLLFLNNVTTVSFKIMRDAKEDEKEVFKLTEYSVKPNDVQDFKHFQGQFAKTNKAGKSDWKSWKGLSRDVCIQHTKGGLLCSSFHLHVFEQCGFADAEEISCRDLQEIQSSKLRMVPKGAVAVFTPDSNCEMCANVPLENAKNSFQGVIKISESFTDRNGIFCTLPLPAKSDLPVLVNGHFALDYENRRNLSTNQYYSIDRTWNELILKHCILPCYTRMLVSLANEIILKEDTATDSINRLIHSYYSRFPSILKKPSESGNSYWDFIKDAFYKYLFKNNLPLLLVHNENKKEVISCNLNSFLEYKLKTPVKPSAKPPLLKPLQAALIKTDTVPVCVSKSFEICEVPLREVSPSIVRKLLFERSHDILHDTNKPCDIESQTTLECTENVISILIYCVWNKNSEEVISLEGLPLCLLADGTVTIFSEKKKIYYTEFGDLISSCLQLFIHREAWGVLNSSKINANEYSCFRKFSLSDFSSLVHHVLPVSKYKNKAEPFEFNKNEEDEKWLSNVWRYIVSVTVDDLSPIGMWSLLLAKRYNKMYLLPVAQHKAVLHLVDESRPNVREVKSALEKCMIFESPFRKKKDSEKERSHEKVLKKHVYGSIDVIENMVNALTYVHNCFGIKELSGENCQNLLIWLDKSDVVKSQILVVQLKKLPLFQCYDRSTSEATGSVVGLPVQSIPLKGLDLAQNYFGCKFLKENFSLRSLYEKLGFCLPNQYDFYYQYIVSAFSIMTDDMVYEHMNFIMNQINQRMASIYAYDQSFGLLMQKLNSTKFISINGGRYAANELYDPNVEIFKLMLESSEFPPDKYMSPNWYTFLVTVGLKNKLDQNLFKRFALSLENGLDKEKSLQVSKLLCVKLFKNEEFFGDNDFLAEIKSIRFLIPNKMRDSLERIFRSINKEKIENEEKLCFQNSVRGEYLNVFWTSMAILPSYAKPNNDLDDHLNVISVSSKVVGVNKAHLERVVTHIKNITNSTVLRTLTNSCKEIPESFREEYKNVLKSIYQYLKSVSTPTENLEELPDDISFMLVDDGCKLENPRKSILSCERIIVPYLNAVWFELGEYFNLFEKLGCKSKSCSLHYAVVLENILQSSSETMKNPNEIIAVKQAVTYLSQVLKNSKLENDVMLYLPTVSFQSQDLKLVLSTKAIYVNDYCLERRLKNFTERILLPKYGEGSQDDQTNENLIKHLPDNLKPTVLTDIVQEELQSSNEDIVMVGGDHISQQIKMKVESSQFIQAMRRLIKHDLKTQDTGIDVESLLIIITDALQLVEVAVYKNICTQFTMNGEVIEGSSEMKPIFAKLNDKRLLLCFALSTSQASEVYGTVAKRLLSVFKQPISSSESILLLPQILECPIGEITALLDKQGILKDSTDSSFLDYDKNPTPGEPIPLELHALFSYEFSEIGIGEYVALEEVDEDEECIYLYAIVRSKIPGDQNDRFLQKYGVQVTSAIGEIKEVESYKLFRFRTFYHSDNELMDGVELFVSEQDMRPYEEIIAEIRNVLRSVTGQPRKRIARRLFLRWHPDKNPPKDKELATKVFQFIQNELERLEKGISSYFSSWNQRANRESQSYRTYKNNFRSRRSNTNDGCSVPPTFSTNNPQPTESRRWFRQAKFDLQAAESLQLYEWICFLSHQAAEKALKASQYLIHYEKNHSHNLVTISAGLSGTLPTLATQMERIVHSSAHLRYPNCWSIPNIPHTEYSKEDSDQALVLARKILEMVDAQIQQI